MTTSTTGSVLVVGGGIAGIQASLDLADAGYRVVLAEQSSAIGGVMSQLDKTFPTNDCCHVHHFPQTGRGGPSPEHRSVHHDRRSVDRRCRRATSPSRFANGPASSIWIVARPAANAARCVPSTVSNDFDQGLGDPQGGVQKISPGHAQRIHHRKKGDGPLQGRLPGQPQFSGLHRPDGPGQIQGSLRAVPQRTPLPRHLRPDLPSPL
jgi:monoamine oxidase